MSFTVSWILLKFISIESVMPTNYLILCCSLLLLPSIFPSIKVFSDESALYITWPKYWSFSCSIIPSKVIPGLISFRMDWLDLLVVDNKSLPSLGELQTLLECSRNGFRFSISPSNEHPGLISFRMDWLDLFAVQGTLKSLLQHYSQKHQFFSAQLSL